MNRENNRYINEVGEVLTALEMNQFVTIEAKRQYEECTECNFNDLSIFAQQECILEQWNHQLEDRGWKAI
jgi:hypothetical protein